MESLNFHAGWIAVLLGIISGMLIGLFFHKDTWLEGYGSYRRRMVRLGHIAFFGIGFINLFYALSIRSYGLAGDSVPSILLLIGLVGMPAVCFATAWRKPLRHLFAIPVISLMGAVILIVRKLPWE
jgi:hypothetical protein